MVSMIYKPRLLVSLGLLLILLSGCAGSQAPNIDVQDIRGQTSTVNFSHPNKPTLVVFWATSCPSCIEEIPQLIALQKQFFDQINIIAVAMDYDDPAQLMHFVEKNHLPYQVVHDKDKRISQGFGGVFVTPTNMLLSSDGEQVWQTVGTPDPAVLVKRIQDLLITKRS